MAIGKLTNDREASASILPNGLTKQHIERAKILHLILLSRKNINTGIGKTSFSNTIPTKRWGK
tara:strand:+ start:472 stop:660 length:189 start_codon:yes stop_codon:yes gene_type:complete